MAMQCNRCDGPMMLETVIQLRRRLVGFRETRSQGAYCATCKIGVPIATRQSATVQPSALVTRRGGSARELWPTWRHADLRRA
jgi:hypothetical protein